VTGESNETAFTMVRIGYDPAEVDERLADLRTRLAASDRRSAALENMLRNAVAQASQLLHTLDHDPRGAAGRATEAPERARSGESDRADDAPDGRASVGADAAASRDTVASSPHRRQGLPADVRAGTAETVQPMTTETTQWVRGTIREISRTEAGATIWVVPEDQPQSVVSFFFTNEAVGQEAVEFVCAGFAAGETVRVWHNERSGIEIEHA
jgi:hypothetical protein